jgi:opacity protein-like surface antigen
MKWGKACLILSLFLTAAAVPLQAQLGFFVGGGATMPSGDFGDYARTGWMALGGMNFGVGMPVSFRAEGMYGSNSHEGDSGDKTNLLGGMASASYVFGLSGPISPYITAGIGALSHQYSPGTGESISEWKALFGGGAGINFSLAALGLFLEARYLVRDDTAFIPLVAGIRFGG